MRSSAEAPSSFPHWVTWVSLAIALLLFFGNTGPALREREQLRAASEELLDLRARWVRAIEVSATGNPGADDLQSLLVAIDRLGWTPAELLRHYPEPAVAGGAGTGR